MSLLHESGVLDVTQHKYEHKELFPNHRLVHVFLLVGLLQLPIILCGA